MQTIYLVRHAIAENRASWSGPDELRPLTPDGLQQAERLANLLGERSIRRVLSSPALRCKQTVEPLARRLSLAVEDARVLHEGNPLEAALRYLVGLGHPSVAGCTHGDLLTDLVNLLVRQQLIEPAAAKLKKGSTWVLSMDGEEIRRAEYLPPP